MVWGYAPEVEDDSEDLYDRLQAAENVAMSVLVALFDSEETTWTVQIVKLTVGANEIQWDDGGDLFIPPDYSVWVETDETGWVMFEVSVDPDSGTVTYTPLPAIETNPFRDIYLDKRESLGREGSAASWFIETEKGHYELDGEIYGVMFSFLSQTR